MNAETPKNAMVPVTYKFENIDKNKTQLDE